MLTLFDYLDPQRAEERRDAQRDDAARYRASRENARREGSPAATTPLAGERYELLASLSEMWVTKEHPSRPTDVLDGCPIDVTPGLPRRPRAVPIPALGAWVDWLQVMLVASVLVVTAFIFILGWKT